MSSTIRRPFDGMPVSKPQSVLGREFEGGLISPLISAECLAQRFREVGGAYNSDAYALLPEKCNIIGCMATCNKGSSEVICQDPVLRTSK